MAKELKLFEAKFESSYSPLKRRLFSQIGKSSKVLEIGPGTGVNFKYYPRGLKLTALEPNELLHNNLRENAHVAGIELKIIKGFSDSIPLKDSSFDFVVSTLVLCSVKSLKSTLDEIIRVLKIKGKFLFVEHVLDERNSTRMLAQKIWSNPLWKFMGDNCHPDRKISKAIMQAKFKKVQVNNYLQEGLGIWGWIIKSHIYGSAVK